MTPRSRKPITAIESLTETKSIGFESLLEESEANSPVMVDHIKPTLDQYSIEQVLNENPDHLSATFKDYLMNRNLLANADTVPLPDDDDSFSSQPDDFVSSTDLKDLSESNMSESFLYCMNGNNPAVSDSKRKHNLDVGSYEPQTKKVYIGETTL